LTSTVAWQYGVRNDLQLGVALPHVVDEAEAAGVDATASGIGDLELLAKWRCHRWDAPRVSINSSLIAAVTLPTGDDDRVEHGLELDPEHQPGSGSVDPAFGAAITPEPGRWRFNAAILHQLRTDLDDDGDRPGSAWFGELAVGNRFWLEPYPGPFMRLDVFVHWYDEARDRADGQSIADSGGERIAVGATWAFRPRPSLDFQVSGEVPVWRDANGTQLDDDWSVQFAFGHRF
ncbi:MAG: transporter, partial [Planctomycetes bacterium]|nr:transporter [Planctomycetota bacterium]